jgi:hypothetical protein
VLSPERTPVAERVYPTSADAQNVELVGQIGGATLAVAVQGDYAYLGVGPRLVVLDVSDPANPTMTGQGPVFPSIVEGVYVTGGYAYVAAGSSGLRVVDVSNPAAPVEVGFYDTPGHAEGVYAAGNYAYVADRSAGLRVVDVSNPAAPVEVGFYGTPGYAHDVYVVGDYAYVADDWTGLRIISVADPIRPTEIGFYTTPWREVNDVYVVGTLAYVAESDEPFNGSLRVISVADPVHPIELGSIGLSDRVYAVHVVGDYAYATYWYGLRVISISDPRHPTLVGYYNTTPGLSVHVVGGYAYMAGVGLRVVSISDPTQPVEVGFYPVLVSIRSVYVADDYAHVTAGGLGVVSVSNPAHPIEVAFYDTYKGESQDVYVQGDYAYVASYYDAGWDVGLEVVSISDPTNPTRMGFYETTGNRAQAVYVSGDYAYVADWGGLRIISVADPAHPTEVSFYQTPSAAMDVYVLGNYAYVASSSAGLRVISVSDPANPIEVGFYDTGLARAVYVAGQYAYVADDTGLRMISVADPTQPTELGYSEPPHSGDWDVAVAGGYAYVTGAYGLRVVDVSNPAAPVEVGTYHVPDDGYGVHVAGGYAYVAGGAGGLFILRFTNEGPPPISVPASHGSLRLTAASSYTPAQPIAPTVRVDNSTDTANTYTVTVSLLQNGAVLDAQSRNVTVPGGGSATLDDFNFGTWPAGSYQLVAELWLGTTRLHVQGPLDLQVILSEGQQRAISEGAKLKGAADAELDEMIGIVVNRYSDSLSNLPGEVVSFLTGQVVTWLKPIGQAAGGFSATDIDKAVARVTTKILGIRDMVADPLRDPVHRRARQAVEGDLKPERRSVASRQEIFNTFITGRGNFAWTDGMAQVVSAYQDAIRNRTEWEPILGFLPPPLVAGPTTLRVEDWTFGLYKAFSGLLGWLIFLGSLVILILAGLAALKISLPTLGGSLAAYIAALPGLIAIMAKGKLVIAAALVIFAITMHMQAEVWVAPSVTREHDQGLDSLSQRIQESIGLSFDGLTTTASVQDGQVVLSTRLTNADVRSARPLVETYLYSVDGRVVEIFSQQPSMTAWGTETLRETVTLPPGRYKAVTAVHTREKIGLARQVLPLEIPGPQVALEVSLDETQLSLGQAVHATIALTNTNTISETGDLAVLAEPSDDQNLSGWLVNLAPGGSQRLEHRFVPQAAGSYRLRVSVTDGTSLLAAYDAAYIVGNGAALAVNVAARDIYSPGIAVTIPITATNAGNAPTSTALSLVTLDRLADLTAVYTDTLPLSVDAGASVATTATALPSAQAQPGLYTARLFLGDDLYTSLDFAVSAEDTLFADIYPDTIFPAVGDAVTLTVQVMNSVYTYTDALVDVALWRPDGITQTVAMNPIGTGRYQGAVTAPITGTYLATAEVSKPNYRAVGNSTFFVAGQPSQLLPTVDGRPILGTAQPVTVTVRNEQGVPIIGAGLVVSGTLEYLTRQTDAAGQAVLQLSPTITEPYQVSLEKLSFTTTLMDLPVWVAPDTTPPALFLDAPSITNQTPLTVTGLTEVGAGLTLNSQAVAVDAQGRFTTTVALSEGANTLNAAATDAVSNTTTVTRTVTLDTVPSALAVTNPVDGLFSLQEVISVTGSIEVGASLMVSNTLATVDPASGAFSTWTLLQPGVNIVPVTVADAAGNTTTITRSVAYSCVFGDFDGSRQVNIVDVMGVASRWGTRPGDAGYVAIYDLDHNGEVNVGDVQAIVAQWQTGC